MEMRPLYGEKGVGVQNGQNGNSRPFIPSSSQKMMIPGRSRFGTYQSTHSDKAILGFAIFVNCLLMILALGALFVGIFLNTYRGSYADLCSDNEWFVAAGCMLAVGCLLLIFVILSFVAMCYKSSKLLSAFIMMLMFLFVGEVVAGIYAFARRNYIEDRFSACMKDAYQSQYMDPEFKHVTEAWDTFQDRFDCCGVDDPLDYLTNNKISSAPKSCGGTKADAVGRQPCFRVIKREVLDNFYMIGGAAIGIAFIQIFAMILNGLVLHTFHKREEYE